jgi:hypothetical protein
MTQKRKPIWALYTNTLLCLDFKSFMILQMVKMTFLRGKILDLLILYLFLPEILWGFFFLFKICALVLVYVWVSICQEDLDLASLVGVPNSAL